MRCLITARFLPGRKIPFKASRFLISTPGVGRSKLLRRAGQALALLVNFHLLALSILRERPQLVLLDSYTEYLAPLWAWSVALALRVTGAVGAVNLHDPVRDFRVGPDWWHSWSVQKGYSFVSVALVHASVPPEANVPPWVKIAEVPVGIYDLPAARRTREAMRGEWGVGAGHVVFLSFGFIRNGKNIDLLVRALQQVPRAFLVIAGRPQSQLERPMQFYESLARELGVRNRCYFQSGFVGNDELGDYFGASDFVALTYSRGFRSQSGVLNIAAAARKPVLASSAPGPLIESVQRFQLGVALEPDSLPAIVAGMRSLVDSPPVPDWSGYEVFAGWDRNVSELLRVGELCL